MKTKRILPLLISFMISGCTTTTASSISSTEYSSEASAYSSESAFMTPFRTSAIDGNPDIQDSIAEKISSNIKLANPNIAPEEQKAPIPVDKENYHFFTYDYYGNMIADNDTSESMIYNSTLATLDNNYCSFISVNVDQILLNHSLTEEDEYTLYLNLGGTLNPDISTPYYIWDYNGKTFLDNVFLNENSQISIACHHDSTSFKTPTLIAGHMNLIIFRFRESSAHEKLIVNDCSEEVITGKEIRDYSYGDSSDQTMDISIPYADGKKKLPVIVTLHGGYWTSCSYDDIYDKKYFSYLYDEHGESNLAKEGFIHVNLNYRVNGFNSSFTQVTDPVSVDEMLEDLNTCLTLLDTESEFGRADLDFLCLWGFSAGAHLSMLYSFSEKSTYQPKMLISEGGPTDLTEMFRDNFFFYKSLLAALIGEENVNLNSFGISNLSAISPVDHIDKVPEFSILTQSLYDDQVPYEQRQDLIDTGYFTDDNSYVPDVDDVVSSHTQYVNIDWENEYLPYLNQYLK